MSGQCFRLEGCATSDSFSRFIGVTDRFLAELQPVSSGQVLKDMDLRYENLVRGLRHVRLKVSLCTHLIDRWRINRPSRFGRQRRLKRAQSSLNPFRNPLRMPTECDSNLYSQRLLWRSSTPRERCVLEVLLTSKTHSSRGRRYKRRSTTPSGQKPSRRSCRRPRIWFLNPDTGSLRIRCTSHHYVWPHWSIFSRIGLRVSRLALTS